MGSMAPGKGGNEVLPRKLVFGSWYPGTPVLAPTSFCVGRIRSPPGIWARIPAAWRLVSLPTRSEQATIRDSTAVALQLRIRRRCPALRVQQNIAYVTPSTAIPRPILKASTYQIRGSACFKPKCIGSTGGASDSGEEISDGTQRSRSS